MKNDKRGKYLTRNDILKQLSDVEVTHVSTAETAAHLAEGDEYLDLEQLDHGVRKACRDITSPMGHVLPKKAVPAATWQKLIALSMAPSRVATMVPVAFALSIAAMIVRSWPPNMPGMSAESCVL